MAALILVGPELRLVWKHPPTFLALYMEFVELLVFDYFFGSTKLPSTKVTPPVEIQGVLVSSTSTLLSSFALLSSSTLAFLPATSASLLSDYLHYAHLVSFSFVLKLWISEKKALEVRRMGGWVAFLSSLYRGSGRFEAHCYPVLIPCDETPVHLSLDLRLRQRHFPFADPS